MKNLPVMLKKLRYYARFIVVCLLLCRRKVVKELVASLAQLIKEYITILKPTDAQEWQLVLQEITLFLQADAPLLIKTAEGESSNNQEWREHSPRGLRRTNIITQKQNLRLKSCILIGSHQHQVKFSELTLDMFRMMLIVELEPLEIKSGLKQRHHNPRKYLLYRPSVNTVLYYIASAQNELKEHDVLLLYISADSSKPAELNTSDNNSNIVSYLSGGVDLNGGRKVLSNPNTKIKDCLTPGDLMPFLRHPLFLIVDSDNSSAFLGLTNIFGVPVMVLASPEEQPSDIPEASSTGNLFTYFLHDPLNAFCLVVFKTVLTQAVYEQCNSTVRQIFSELHLLVTTSSQIHYSCMQFVQDTFLEYFVVRFIFCYAVLNLHKNFQQKKDKYLPKSQPPIPDSLLEHPNIILYVEKLAGLLGVTEMFNFPKK
eukprot:TRINITY_DN1104_c0_g1_i1.p1 TRINITY_DN1104_c0_g1~~TRINITY_DN1104_c0_g1_i1.p1  ORF type:complete len:427 (+),score=39.47 TRINITY_DN1104_c0_g1_i1:201-1481(+)